MESLPEIADHALRLLVAALLGGVIGFDRERRQKPAGLRTHMLVALGAATFTLSALELSARVAMTSPDVARIDPNRVAQGLIGGIGFLGAGAIIRGGDTVFGLTTAGSIWFAGAIGLSVGSGFFLNAVMATALAVIVLEGVRPLEGLLHSSRRGDPGEGGGGGDDAPRR